MADTAVYLFPGQGAQAVGMGQDLYHRFSSARAVFQEADDILGFSLSTLCFSGPEAELKRTINTQPAVLVTSYACLRAAQETGALSQLSDAAYVAGHSLGEYTALIVAEVLSFPETLLLVRERARLMEEAGAQELGSMAAILGLDEEIVEAVCAETGVEIANTNSPEQIVISGERDALERASQLAKAKGARRVIPLEVSAAFHSRLMQPASDGIVAAIAQLPFRDARTPIVANSTARPVVSSAEVKQELRQQLCAPVRWQRSIGFMLAQGVTDFIEIGPGRVLTGLVKRISAEVTTRNLSDVPSLVGEQAA